MSTDPTRTDPTKKPPAARADELTDDVTEEITPEPGPRPAGSPRHPGAESGSGGYTTHRRAGLDNAARAVSSGSHTTLFQPGVMIDDILDGPAEPEAAMATGDSAPQDDSATQVVQGVPRPPALRIEKVPYFLIVGAPPGEERLPILHARTTFGRDRGDVRLRDKAVSSLHFQLDVVGREFFIRDLGSRNGTQLNGYPVRYNEILPGDEVRAGETVLIFRTEDDGLADRRSLGTRSEP